MFDQFTRKLQYKNLEMCNYNHRFHQGKGLHNFSRVG